MTLTTVPQRLWTRREFDRMVELGLIQPEERVELVEGIIYRMAPQRTPHTVGVGKVERALQRAFGEECWIRVQMPLVVDPDSKPEPDLSVVSGSPDDYLDAHPERALLVAEVADTSLDRDRGLKLRIYALAEVPEYWILNLVDRVLEVYRDPIVEPGKDPHYRAREILGEAESVVPLRAPGASIGVADLLPRP